MVLNIKMRALIAVMFPLLTFSATSQAGRAPAVLLAEVKILVKPALQNNATRLNRDDVQIPTQDGTFLTGSLLLPQKPLRGAVLFLVGSGATNRFENVAGEFTTTGAPIALLKSLAESLTQNGIAVLAYDKRGVRTLNTAMTEKQLDPKSFARTTPAQLLADAKDALQFLRAKTKLPVNQIGILGHSEGGVLALKIAEKERNLRALYLIGTMIRPFAEIVRYQMVDVPLRGFDATATGATPASREKFRAQAEESLAAFLREFTSASPQVGSSAGDPVPAAWYRDYLAEKDGYFQRLLPFCARINLFHGTEDRQTPVQDAIALHGECTRRGTPLAGNFVYEGLGHGLSAPLSATRDSFGPIASVAQSHLIAKISADFR